MTQVSPASVREYNSSPSNNYLKGFRKPESPIPCPSSLAPRKRCVSVTESDIEEMTIIDTELKSEDDDDDTTESVSAVVSSPASTHTSFSSTPSSMAISPYPPAPHYSEMMSFFRPHPIPAVVPHNYVYIPVVNPLDGRCYYQPVPRDRLATVPHNASIYPPSPASMHSLSPYNMRHFDQNLHSTPPGQHSPDASLSVQASPSSGYSSRSTDSDVIVC